MTAFPAAIPAMMQPAVPTKAVARHADEAADETVLTALLTALAAPLQRATGADAAAVDAMALTKPGPLRR